MKKFFMVTLVTAAIVLNLSQAGKAACPLGGCPKYTPKPVTGAACPVCPNSQLSVAETLSSSGNFKIFSKMLQESGLAKTLKGKGPYTVFAPPDQAFAKLPPGTVYNLLNCPQYKCELNRIVRYHIVKDPLACEQMVQANKIITADGRCIKISKGCNHVCLDQAQVLQTNIRARNGMIHIVDDVLIPGNTLGLG